MSRKKYASVDDIEKMLDFKFEQLEKRVENIERVVFSQDSQILSGNQNNQQSMQNVLQLLTTIIDRQQVSGNHNGQGHQSNQGNQGNIKDGNITEKKDESKTSASNPIVMGRLRTLF